MSHQTETAESAFERLVDCRTQRMLATDPRYRHAADAEAAAEAEERVALEAELEVIRETLQRAGELDAAGLDIDRARVAELEQRAGEIGQELETLDGIEAVTSTPAAEVEARFTRLSLGTQIRQELEQLERAGRISGWTFDAGDDARGIRYRVVQPSGEVFVMSPGELADWLNGRHGCDVRYGKQV